MSPAVSAGFTSLLVKPVLVFSVVNFESCDTGVFTTDVCGVVMISEDSEPVLPIVPASTSLCVTEYVPVSKHEAPGATVAQVMLFGEILVSVTNTLVWVTVPVFVAVTV